MTESVEDAPGEAVEADDEVGVVEVPADALAGLGGAFKFAQSALAMAESGRHLSREEIMDLAMGFGLRTMREPTEEEIADPEWSGHSLGIQAGEPRVIDATGIYVAAAEVVSYMDEAVEPDEAQEAAE